MSFESLMKEWQTLNLSMEALAALGAELRLRRECSSDNSQVRALLRKAVDHLHPGLLDDIDPNQELAALALIQASFRQAIDLLENPGRAPGWSYEDPAILESQGQASRLIVRGMETLAGQRPGFDATLRRSGAFLDIGTGVGWIAIEAARCWPMLRVVGIDFWEPALNLARKNLAPRYRIEGRQRLMNLGGELAKLPDGARPLFGSRSAFESAFFCTAAYRSRTIC